MALGPLEIRRYLPHRYPFLLVDRVEAIANDGSRIVAIKNVSANEPFFQGHFPDYPIMPGVLIAEALAQAGGILIAHAAESKPDAASHPGVSDETAQSPVPSTQSPAPARQLGVLAGLDSFRFRRPVHPGDTLRLEVTVTKLRGPVGKLRGRATVNGELVAEGEITFAVTSLPTASGTGPAES